MKRVFWFAASVIAMTLWVFSFWAGFVLTILAVCKIIAVALWMIIMTWVVTLIVLGFIIAWTYSLAEAAEEEERKKSK